MISRIWHGRTRPENAAAYERLLKTEILPGIAARGIAGYRGAHLLRRDADDEVEFVTVLWFESPDAVRAFAGEDYETAVVPPAACALLTSFDARARHYETVLTPGPAGG
jgi:antibiotic biosynthesis monooxygenase (ABM) superfamily enzyme